MRPGCQASTAAGRHWPPAGWCGRLGARGKLDRVLTHSYADVAEAADYTPAAWTTRDHLATSPIRNTDDRRHQPDQVAAITRYVDIEAPPPAAPTALVLFGTNQLAPVTMAAERHHQGLAPLIIVTGGVNRHNGIIEGQVFRRLMMERGVPDSAIRVEDTSANTWQNIENSMPFLTEARESGLPLTAVSKWFHRRAIHCLRTLLPDLDEFHGLGWEPIYEGVAVTRTNWVDIPDGKRRVIREWQEIPRRIADGSFREANIVNGAWR